MRNIALVVLVVVAAACGSKRQEQSGGSGSAAADKPITCPPGAAVKDGACVVVVTPAKVAAIGQQQTRIDELAKLLDTVDTAAAPIELLDGLRKLDSWRVAAAANDRLKVVDEVVARLGDAVKTLRTFRAGLGEVSGRLGNLKLELDRVLQDTGTTRKIEELRAQISAQVRSAVEPFAAQVTDTIRNALAPLVDKLDQASAMLDIACGTVTLTGGADAKAMCKDAKAAFAKAIAYIDDFKARPAKLFADVTEQLEAELEQLIDSEGKKLIDAAQAQVNEALRLPPAGADGGGSAAAGSGSAAAGSGSAAAGNGSAAAGGW